MKARLDEVRELGAATAEEWSKGLEADGREKAADSARWEQWELAGGFRTVVRSISLVQQSQRPVNPMAPEVHSTFEWPNSSSCEKAPMKAFIETRQTDGTQAHPWSNQCMHTISSVTAIPGSLVVSATDQNSAPSSTLPPKPTTPMSTYGPPNPSSVPTFSLPAPKPHTRVERSIHDVNEKKNARRIEIEKRCADLDPPIRPSTLALMESFSAALQIAMPLTDQAWELLRPRLIAQREAAEQREREQIAQNHFLIQQNEDRKQQEAQLREAKENLDREWDESQKSVREKLEIYADTFIREQWQNGDAVTNVSCAQFAADLLLHVRHRFYASLAQEDARMRAMGIPIPADAPNAAPTRKLTLENMRWVYENKAKPLTEHFQKELFLCNACDNQGRYYSLDSVVQHFAAKHTDSLSMGTAVVYWKADWPELPPFDPNPTAAKASLYSSMQPASALSSAHYLYNPPLAYHTLETATPTNSNYLQQSQPNDAQSAYQKFSQAYGSTSPAYQGPTSPQDAFHSVAQTAPRTYSQPITSSYATTQAYGLPQSAAHHGWARQQASNNVINSYQQHLPTSHPNQQLDFGARPGSAMSHISQNPPHSSIAHNFRSQQFPRLQPLVGTRPAFNSLSPGQPMGIYQVQIQELAQNAREVWNGTSEITEMPDSVRVQVIIRHVVLRFKDKYTNEPNLALFTDGLNNSSLMSPLRALSNLSCKACTTEHAMSENVGHLHPRDLELRMHTLPALLAHFQSAHVEHVQPTAISPTDIEMPRLDWKFDMVEMPDATVVRNLVYSPGITQSKLSLIAAVLPSYFPSPLPQVGLPSYSDIDNGKTTGSVSRTTPQNHDFRLVGSNATKAHVAGDSSAPIHYRYLPLTREGDDSQRFVYRARNGPNESVSKEADVAREDEYDPHRPAYVNAGDSDRRESVNIGHNDYIPRKEHEPVSGHEVYSDVRVSTRPNVASFIENNRITAAPDYSFPPTKRLSPSRSDKEAQESLTRDAGVMEHRPRWSVQDSRLVQVDRRATPAQEPLNAAEQFLRSFDLTSDAPHESSHHPPAIRTSNGDEYEHDVGEDTVSRTRDDDHRWVSSLSSARRVDHSGNSSQSDIVYVQGPYETPNEGIFDPHQSHEYSRYARRSREPQQGSHRSLAASPDTQTLSRVRAGHFPPHLRASRDSPSRRSNSRFERYEAQRQGSQSLQTRSPAVTDEPRPVHDTFHHDPYTTYRPAGRQTHPASPEEEQHRDYPQTDEDTNRQAPEPSQQIRYIQQPRYFEPIHDRYVEYVRVAPRDSQASSGYYVERPVTHSGVNEYVGYEPTRPHEQVFEEEGHLYTRARLSPDEYRDSYTRQTAHQ